MDKESKSMRNHKLYLLTRIKEVFKIYWNIVTFKQTTEMEQLFINGIIHLLLKSMISEVNIDLNVQNSG